MSLTVIVTYSHRYDLDYDIKSLNDSEMNNNNNKKKKKRKKNYEHHGCRSWW